MKVTKKRILPAWLFGCQLCTNRLVFYQFRRITEEILQALTCSYVVQALRKLADARKGSTRAYYGVRLKEERLKQVQWCTVSHVGVHTK